MLGYKVAKSFGKRVVITLEIPEDAITNVKRTNIVHAETAKYRTMKAKVIKIEDSDGKTYNEAVSFNYDKNSLTYTLDEELVCHDFDMNLEDVCSKGIHFFLTKQMAETFQLDKLENGVLTDYYENGVKSHEETFVNGVKHGLTTYWNKNGIKEMEISYVNGICERGTQWYENGVKKSEQMETNGKLHGLYIHWHDNGNKCQETTYVDGKKQGMTRGWYKNGKKKFEHPVLDGKMHGDCHYWDENGNKRTYTFHHGTRLYGVGCCIVS
jgi:antitoxin component YwqK of YwqJK toxin-antitoxin module